MNESIKKVAVLGSGVMGSAIAAHFANIGMSVVLLDIVPHELTQAETSGRLDLKSPALRNRIALAGVEAAKRSHPPAFYSIDLARNIAVGNFEDNLEWLGDVDWTVEAVVERLDIKRNLLEKVDRVRKKGTVVSSNTSGIPIGAICQGMSEDFRRYFLGTHFFNPPRYMRLLEIIPGPDTQPEVIARVAEFGERILGKGIVYCKDTPNFIANRIGVFAVMHAIRAMLEEAYTIEEVDQLTGPITGKPKSATFRTADLVGIDTLVHVADNLFEAAPQDEMRDTFRTPAFMRKMVELKMLGEKSGRGFYKKVKGSDNSQILTLDLSTLDYRVAQKPQFPSIEAVKGMEDLRRRYATLAYASDRAAAFVWKTTSALLRYAGNRVPEISDDIVNIDKAMRLGFNWRMGPFETWDAIGVEKSVNRMRAEGHQVPPLVERLLSTGNNSFYERRNGISYYFDIRQAGPVPVAEPPGLIVLSTLKDRGRVIIENPGASLIDLGDGVACLEFHSKMNAIGPDILALISSSLSEVGRNFEGLVIGNDGENFSVGANLVLVLMAAREGEWDDLSRLVSRAQQAISSLRYSPKPVVAAPFGMTLGGGCEVCLGADRIRAAAELYMGLVEVGVGIIPAGGGTKEMLIRSLQAVPADGDADLFPHVRRVFELIGKARISSSAADARRVGYLCQSDSISINRDHLIRDAKNTVLAMVKEGYRMPSPRTDIPVLGEPAFAALKLGLYLMKTAGRISEYDMHIGTKLASVLCGGDLTSKTLVTEQYILELEREAFLSLCGEKKTQDRMAYMLKHGKPLRN